MKSILHKKRKRKTEKNLSVRILRALSAGVLILAFLVLFYLQQVQISGNEYCDNQEIMEALTDDPLSINSVYIVLKYKLGLGEKPECIDQMKVSLKNPWTIHVKVREKTIVGYVSYNGKYGYFDNKGLVVMVSDKLIEGLPVIDGFEVTGIEKYQKLQSGDADIFEQILVLSQEIPKHELDPDRIICQDDNLYMQMGNVLIVLGDTVTPEQVAQIEPIVKKLTGKSGVLHLENYSESADSIVFNTVDVTNLGSFKNVGDYLINYLTVQAEQKKAAAENADTSADTSDYVDEDQDGYDDVTGELIPTDTAGTENTDTQTDAAGTENTETQTDTTGTEQATDQTNNAADQTGTQTVDNTTQNTQ